MRTSGFRHALLLLLIATLLHCTVAASLAENETPAWKTLDDGLYLSLLTVPSIGTEAIPADTDTGITILRIDPARYEFLALTSTETGKLLTPKEWADDNNLAAVINASMYLPDHRTSTGYLRNGSHLNNDHVNKRFGNFFVANPIQDTLSENATTPLPIVTILDRQSDDWEKLIGRYRIVVQNFRMISAGGTPLWPQDGESFSIAAIAQDAEGYILFIHSRPPMTVRQFTDYLMTMSLNIIRAMYVEGGPQASLHVRSKDMRQTWSGRHAGDFWSGEHVEWQLPNVIGIRKK